MSAPVRHLFVQGLGAFQWLRRRVHASLDAWAGEWVSEWASDIKRLECLHVVPIDQDLMARQGEYQMVRTAAGRMWFRQSPDDRLQCSRAVVGSDLMLRIASADEWTRDITDHARSVRNEALCASLMDAPILQGPPASTGELPAELFAVGSGAVRVQWAETGLYAVADAGVWRSMPPIEPSTQSLPKLTPMDRAAHRAKAQLDVMLGSVDIGLPSLLDLHRGDVLRLPQRLDQGIAVLCGGKPLAYAVLGMTDGRKSVRILGNDPTTNNEDNP